MFIGSMMATRGKADPSTSLVVAVIAGIFGAILGAERAFTLRFQAQQALCQMKIAEYTRVMAENRLPEKALAVTSAN